MTARSNPELVDVIDDVLGTTLSLSRDLTEAEADLPTECPGWTVRDQLAHIVGLEQVLDGAPAPDIELPPLDHVSSDLDRSMERIVHIRRQLPFVAIADELAGLRPRRVSHLRSAVEAGDPMVPGPSGERRLSAALPVRVFDLWAHEQDIRRAVGLPVRTDCVAAEVALERALAAWVSGLPERTEGVDGSLVIVPSGERADSVQVTLGSGDGATAELSGDSGELTRLFCGRMVATSSHLSGDDSVVEGVRRHLAMTP